MDKPWQSKRVTEYHSDKLKIEVIVQTRRIYLGATFRSDLKLLATKHNWVSTDLKRRVSHSAITKNRSWRVMCQRLSETN